MNNTNSFQGISGIRFLVAAASFVILVSGLKAAQSILVPLMFAIFLALLASGPIYWLKSKKVPNAISIILVSLFIVSLFVVVASLLLTSLNQFSARLPHYQGNLNNLSFEFAEYLKKYHIDLSKVLSGFDVANYLDVFTKTLKGMVQAVSSFVVIIIMMIFMILEAASFRSKFQYALGNRVDMGKFDGIAIDVNRYLVIKTLTSALTGISVGLLTSFLNLDFPLLWGLVAFLLNYVPFIGSIIASIPAILLCMVQLDVATAGTLTIAYLVINISVSNFIEPFLMGKRLGLSVLIVFLSLMFWGWVWGPAGALMSVPLTMIVKILFEHSPELNWVSTLMGSSIKTKDIKDQ